MRLKREAEEGSFFEVNLKAVIAFREMGKGHEGLNTFARLMNMKGITWASYKNINNAVFDAYESVAEESMRKVALHIKEDKSAKKHPDNPSVKLCDVSIDGTWQRRGYSSLNGVVTTVSHEKCLDTCWPKIIHRLECIRSIRNENSCISAIKLLNISSVLTCTNFTNSSYKCMPSSFGMFE